MTEESNREQTEARSEIQAAPTEQGDGSQAIQFDLPDGFPPPGGFTPPSPAPIPGPRPSPIGDGPTISSLFPNRAPVGSDALDVLITGGPFAANVQVFVRRANDPSAPVAVAVQRLSDLRLQIPIDRALLQETGFVEVTVQNPPGPVSQPAMLRVEAPKIGSVTPGRLPAGQDATLTITAADILIAEDESRRTGVRFGETVLDAALVSLLPGRITVTLPGALLTRGNRGVALFNPTDNGPAFSNVVNVAVL